MDEMLNGADLDPETPAVEETNAEATKVEELDGKKGLKRGIKVFFVALLIGLVIGFGITSLVLGLSNSREKEYIVSDMSITLTGGFTQQSANGALTAFGSRKVGVFVSRDDLSITTMNMDTVQYAALVIAANGFTDSKIEDDDGITYFIAKQTNDKGISLLHYTYVYKSEDAFWLVQFAVREGQAGSQLENISKWAHSVKFNL
jgi:hypothetical protein